MRTPSSRRCGAIPGSCTVPSTGSVQRTPWRFLKDSASRSRLSVETGSFPVSDRAADIVDALHRYVKRSGAELREGEAKELLLDETGVRGVICKDGSEIYARRVAVATGGVSYPQTGSTGDGYRFAKQAGHTVVPAVPSLVPIVTREDYCREMMGLSLRNVTLTVRRAGKKKPVFSELGEMLFTHFGVSGPLVLSASSHMTGDLGEYSMEIDLKPGLTVQQLDARLLRDFEKFINKDFSNALDELLPRKLIPVAVAAFMALRRIPRSTRSPGKNGKS